MFDQLTTDERMILRLKFRSAQCQFLAEAKHLNTCGDSLASMLYDTDAGVYLKAMAEASQLIIDTYPAL